MSTQFPQYEDDDGFAVHQSPSHGAPVQPQGTGYNPEGLVANPTYGPPAGQVPAHNVPHHPMMPPTYEQPQNTGFVPQGNQFAQKQKNIPIGGFDAQANGLEPGKCVETRVYEGQGKRGPFRTFEIFKAWFIQAEGKWARGKTFMLNKTVLDEMAARLTHLRNVFLEPQTPGHYVWMPSVQQGVAHPQPQQQGQGVQGSSARAPYNPTPPMNYGRPNY